MESNEIFARFASTRCDGCGPAAVKSFFSPEGTMNK